MIVITTFRLRPDIVEEAFLALDTRVQTELAYHETGLVRRTTARSVRETWLVLEIWHSDDAADASASDRADSPLHAEYLSLIDRQTLQSDRFATFD
jgi:hypothetical protein